MDFRAVLVLLSMLCAQAPCRPAGCGAAGETLSAAISVLLQGIRSTLGHLNDTGLLPNVSCSPLNITELLGEEQQPVSAHRLSLVWCHMEELSEEFSEEFPDLSQQLMMCVQFISDMAPQSSNSTSPPSCSLPAFEQVLDGLVFARCFLQLVEQRLSKSKL